MLKKLQKNNKGFTIIEVMIVLAIAGLIILVVLLAIPALQRNGRNTAVKNDAGIIAGQIADFKSNNEGASPTTVANAAGTLTISGAAGTTATTGKMQAGTTVTTSATPASAVGTINVAIGGACAGTTASSRTVAVTYMIETSGAAQAKCLDA